MSRRSALGAVFQMATLTYVLGVGLLCTLALGGLNRAGLLPFGALLPLAFVLYVPLLAMMLVPAAVWVTVMREWFQEARPAGDDWDPREDLALAAERREERRAGAGLGRAEGGAAVGRAREEPESLTNVVGPTLLATFFAVLSLPLVALSLDASDYGKASGYGVSPIHVPQDDPGRWAASFGAVVAAALVAGTIGAPLTRAHAIFGALFTTLVAWVVGIAALPVLPVLLGVNRNGDLGFATLCLDSCGPLIRTDDALSGLDVAKLFLLGPLEAPVAFGLLVVGVACWTPVVRRWARKPE